MDYSFGNWVRRRRKALDLTQQELADRVGCSVATIVKIESDERRPSRQVAELLGQHLQIPPEQQEQFLKVARKEKGVDTLGEESVMVSPPQPIVSRIPPSPGTLLGRDIELVEVTRLVREPHCRLLTLTGPGGIGKTHLSIHLASSLAESGRSLVAFIGLASVNGREQTVTAIADALGIVLYAASDRSQQLISYLQDKDMIVVLDNFEHLAADPDCVDLTGDILRGAHNVKLIVTSRQPLELQAEWVFEVQGLPVPKTQDIDELQASSAVTLFIQRANQSAVGFRPTEADLTAIGRICELVEGLPLGIELAAAWVRALSCPEIAREIQASKDFLALSRRDLPERHRSIRATFEHSWKLLSAEEQITLQRLSIFRGGFTREAAEFVAGANLSLLSALVSKSLLHRAEQGHYDLHELVRQYSIEYLKMDELEYIETQDRHSEYYSSLLQKQGPAFKSADHLTVGRALAAQIANLRQAWRWSGERGQALRVSHAADTLFWLYEWRCDCREGVRLFGYVAKRLEGEQELKTGTISNADDLRAILVARVMAYQGFFCLRQGLHRQSKELLERSLAILRPLAESGSPAAREALSNTLAFLGMLTVSLGDYTNGNYFLNEGLEIKRTINDGWGIAFCLRQLGVLGFYQGAYDEAYRLLSEGLEISRRLGNAWAIAYSLDFLSTSVYARGAYAEAEKLLREGLLLSQQVSDRFTTAYALSGLGLVKQSMGELAEARRFLEDSISIWREIGDLASMAQSLNNLGNVLLELNEPDDAQKCFIEALSVAKNAGLIPVMLDALLGNATLRAGEGLHESSVITLAYIKAHPASTQGTRSRAERLYNEFCSKLSAGESETLPATFHEEVLDQLVQDALGR